jgi:S1-C subfamily serine protease
MRSLPPVNRSRRVKNILARSPARRILARALASILTTALLITLLVSGTEATFPTREASAVAAIAGPSVGFLVVEHPLGIWTGTAFAAGGRLALTAYHLVAGASRILLKFPDRPAEEPRIIETDSANDLAVLAISGLPVRPLVLGSIERVQKGESIILLGSLRIEGPDRQKPTIVEGVVDVIRNGALFIDVPKVSGLDGAPILNLRGEVIGVVRGHLRGEQSGIGFAAPTNAARPLLAVAISRLSASDTPSAPPGQTDSAQTRILTPSAPTQSTSVSVSTLPAVNAQPTPAPGLTPPPPVRAPAQAAPVPAATGQHTPDPGSAPSKSGRTKGQPAPVPPVRPIPSPGPRTQVSPKPTRFIPVSVGQSIGPVQLGMRIQEVVRALGRAKSQQKLDDGSTVYRWFEPPRNDGIGMRVTSAGVVYRIWAINDVAYVTNNGLRVGSTEGQVVAKLGKPTRTVLDPRTKTKTLLYPQLGVWFSIQLEPRYTFYNTIYGIGVRSRL